MKINQIRKRVRYIKNGADGDDEAQHSHEDSLWEDVLLAISAGADNPRELATEALKTKKLGFQRWCA